MSGEKPRPADISTDTNLSRESEFHTVSPVSPLFEEHTHELSAAPQHVTSLESENPPAKPPRPLSPQQQAELTLAEAFPTVEQGVIKAVLIASRGDIEPAFNALLAMTDPTFVPEEPPAQPPRQTAYSPRIDSRYPPQQQRDYNPALVYQDRIDLAPHQPPTISPRSQLEADELLARQLAEHYDNVERSSRQRNAPNQPQRHQRNDSEEDYHSEKEHSFLDDDLPVIKENIRKGFLETQSKVNKWVTEIKKKFDAELEDPPHPTPPAPSHESRASSSKMSSGYTSYDADPRVLSDDFTHLEVKDNSREEVPPRRPPRPVANPKLFQSSATSGNTGQRKVSFQDERDDEDIYRAPSPRRSTTAPAAATPTSAIKQPSPTSKWQPLKSVDPTPLDGYPFSLGDSDDEKDHGLVPEPKVEGAGTKDIK